MIGFLFLNGNSVVNNIVKQKLNESGMLSHTKRIYATKVNVRHNNVQIVDDNVRNIDSIIEKYPNEIIWYFRTYPSSNTLYIPFVEYQCFFLLDNWKDALAAPESGYDAYGVNLRKSPYIHFENNCYWSRGNTWKKPYCAFHLFQNHFLTEIYPEMYVNYDKERQAPYSSLQLQSDLTYLVDVDKELLVLAPVIVFNKDIFDHQPHIQSERPYIVSDIVSKDIFTFMLCKKGRLDLVTSENTDSIVEYYKSLGWNVNFNVSNDTEDKKIDICYTTVENIDKLINKLSINGIIIVKGKYSGELPSKDLDSYTLIGLNESALEMVY